MLRTGKNITNEILKKLKDIKEELNKSIRDKSVIKLSTYDNMLEDIKKIVELAEGNHSQKEVLDELKALYKGIYAIFTSISIDWDAHKNTLSAEQINVSHENLELILKIITLIKKLDEKLSDKIISSDEIIAPNEIASFQDKMKKKLEEMQKQQPSQNTANQDNDGAQSVDAEEGYTELEKEAKIEFSKCVLFFIAEIDLLEYKQLLS
ncbi:hypothetical protein [Wolbachia endosymbiont (group E) of Neria commutata]|uniref:hypothetical protein n=1 Tax=Wolbachia endosymbiont (group E) of Neria commutata TaxID=3066149 RepID=UPI003133304C